MQIQPYLFFDGRCEEAVEFYKKKLGAQVIFMMRFKESPQGTQTCAPADADKIMHCTLKIGDATVMASDGRCENKAEFKGFALSIDPKTPEEAERLFAALSDGGQVQMPMAKTFWSPAFGMVADKFGVSWMVSVMH